MRFALSVGLAVLVALAVVVPIYGADGGGGGQSCESCTGFYNREHQTAVVYCGEPTDGGGNTKCEVRCNTEVDGMGSCSCYEQGDWCYYIVVNG